MQTKNLTVSHKIQKPALWSLFSNVAYGFVLLSSIAVKLSARPPWGSLLWPQNILDRLVLDILDKPLLSYMAPRKSIEGMTYYLANKNIIQFDAKYRNALNVQDWWPHRQGLDVECLAIVLAHGGGLLLAAILECLVWPLAENGPHAFVWQLFVWHCFGSLLFFKPWMSL